MTTKKRKPGQQPHEPTDEKRRVVDALMAAGIKEDTIARYVGITGKTLRKYYRAELDAGGEFAHARVAMTAFEKAVAGEGAFTFFWLKTRAGWRETTHLEVTTPGIVSDTPLDKLVTTDEWLNEYAPTTAQKDLN